MTTHPEVLWAQRSSTIDPEKNVIYLTINLPDIKDSSFKFGLSETTLTFSATAGDASKGIEERDYSFEIEFYKEVNATESTKRLNSRSLYLVLRKKDLQEEYWPRLTKEKVKNSHIKTDFSKWVDEDEQDGEPAAAEEEGMMGMGDMGGMGGMPGMGGMGGMPGMGGMGGMPGMGGMGGMPGLGGMGMPGMGDMGGMDFEKASDPLMMAEMGKGESSGAGDDDGSDDDDGGPPPLEEVKPSN
ncbi:hypothetical protein D9757_002137 [Collybiopsis confluens]|uniref:CS domain-containing protein n=1 Tax=Collybiopsis confluens TaxID=2823264 RepID=A0A8H5HZZ6_9AGAR|nr:hypothetical protein D9757_002137 [Collybiopsis confluens]